MAEIVEYSLSNRGLNYQEDTCSSDKRERLQQQP